uniref:DNA-binding transcriptional regulator, LysR family n=1 Tax=Candidatus Kentrum eta TaxID=2126337 RepID=A0A450V137_9GAMM|nr:MAG: DNA-binding transcriptional regulator, LysR family [Candidatus Kentron sp. H]VFJ98618.1 MAG: DNA-binding transcriptional regulator, LysR family [Candidatus Kentron sp. H]VFK03628.1 MAG: DNA-binding transcriptional regulator, LysR family [Candidatus Kentron sp. H]
MPDRRLQVFHTVARMLSFTRAAEVLHMTQPAVTFQVQQLEEHFNTRLFDRTHHRISLTEAGRHVYEYSDKIFTLYKQMENRLQDVTGSASGVLTLGASMTIAEYMLPSLLGSFKKAFLETTIRLRVAGTEGIVSLVEYNEIDLGIVEAPVINKNLAVELCRMDPLVAVVPPGHALAERESLTPGDLVAYPYIAREEGLGIIQDYLQSAGFDINDLHIIMEFKGFEAIKGAIEAGMGISVLSRTILAKELALGTLVAVEPDPPLQQPFSFVHQKQKFLVPAMDELVNLARNRCQSKRPAFGYGSDARGKEP